MYWWRIGLESYHLAALIHIFDLPSTHVRLKREQELRASREGDRMLRRGKERKDSNTPASGSSMPLCLQWGLDDRVRAKVLQQYSAYG